MKKLILLLASDPEIRNAICGALESTGYFVLNAGGVDRAEQLLRQFTPDLLIVRPYTENLSGHDAASYLRRIRPGIPVLIVGGILDDVSRENRAALKRFEIFPKPFHASELLAKVGEMLNDSAPRSTDHDLG